MTNIATRKLRDAQDIVLRLLGFAVEGRAQLVAGMLHRGPHETTSYWLQLIVSIGIASLGLVVGSAAVIIGAMLVAPLMGPIIALAMGLASGSPFLVLRASSRIAASVGVVIGGSAIITTLLPFHELNAEILARTSPTVLDLVTAGFCALAGVYASLRPGSDTATTAAGTSIGISLVPPLCASGYGLGTTVWSVAGGAALLFITNLAAIVFVGTIAFVITGFNRVDTRNLEYEELRGDQRGSLTVALGRRLSGLFDSKAGPLLRFLMPFVLLATVYVPLRRALDEVAWQVRVRAAIREALAREEQGIVQSRVRVERQEVELLLVLLGSNEDAEAARARIDAEIAEVAGVEPRIQVLAIPDATAFSGLESTFSGLESKLYELRQAPAPAPAPAPVIVAPPPPPTPAEQLDGGLSEVRAAVGRLWPATAVGAPLAIEVRPEESRLRLAVVHLGPSLGPAGKESLERSLAAALERELHVVDVAVPTDAITRAEGDLWLVSRVSTAVRATIDVAEVSVCVVRPRPPSKPTRVDAREPELTAALDELLAAHPRVTTELGEAWAVRFVLGPCPAPGMPKAG